MTPDFSLPFILLFFLSQNTIMKTFSHMYHWLFQAQGERKLRKYYNTDMLVWKLRSFMGEIWNWLCTQRTRRDWRKGGASRGWREAGLRTKELHARPVLGGLKMSRSPHPPTRIFEAFVDAPMWVISHVDHSDGLNSTLLSQVWPLKMAPTRELWVEKTLQGWRRHAEPLITPDQPRQPMIMVS